MLKRFFLILFALTLASCGKPGDDLPLGIDHMPSDDDDVISSTVDNSQTTQSPDRSTSSDDAPAAAYVGVNIEIQPQMIRGFVPQNITPDNVQAGT